MQYIIIEIQATENSTTVVTPVPVFDSVNEAEQKYHTVLAAAAVSPVKCHSAVMLNSDGMVIKSDGYKHETQAE